MKRIKCIGMGFVFALSTIVLASPAAAQTTSSAPGQSSPDQSSLGDYARKVRKDPAAPKPKPKVFDNDNLPMNDKLSIVGPPPSTASGSAVDADKSAAPDSKDAAAKPATDDDQTKKKAAWKAWQDKVSAQKDSIDLASRELDVTTREYQLRAAVMYADVGNRMRNSAQWDKEDADYQAKDRRQAESRRRRQTETRRPEGRSPQGWRSLRHDRLMPVEGAVDRGFMPAHGRRFELGFSPCSPPHTQPEKLFLVMPPMHQMKLSPLRGSQRAQNRMIEQPLPAPETCFTLRDDRIHRRNLCPNLVSHRFYWQASRLRYSRVLCVPQASNPIPQPPTSVADVSSRLASPAACPLPSLSRIL